MREELSFGGYLTSLAGYGLIYNTLDNNKRPTSGLLLSCGQDVAGLGGDVNICAPSWISAATTRSFRISSAAASAGRRHVRPDQGPNGELNYVRMLDDFKMGPNLVRGFQPAGLGPRDITARHVGDALGGTLLLGREP